MSLFRKLLLLFCILILIILTSTLAVVYVESRQTIVELSKQKAVSVIQTIDSALESNIPDYQFESVLLHLEQQDSNIQSFDIYKLNGFLYDIASTDPKRIGKQASHSSVVALSSDKPITTLTGTTLEITAPIRGYRGVVYSANVRFSIASDLKSTHVLLTEVFLVGLCALVLAVLAAWLFTREFLSKPVLAVISAVNTVTTGNLQIDLADSERRHDEIGMLARSFVRMTSNLQQLMARMADTADELQRDFQQLVKSGDYTARGALHVSDVIGHVVDEADAQVRDLITIRRGFEETLVTDNVPRSTANADEIKTWLKSIQTSVDTTQGIRQHLQSIASTANGQIGAIQDVNKTAARLSQMANELRQLIATFEA